jgi:uncharacterized protein (TIGR03437 family)
VTGADPRLTGAPGDGVCTQCHSGTALNRGGGSVQIKLPGDAIYTPGVKQRIQVQVSDPAQKRWGFEFTARLASDLANGQAGALNTVDSNTQVMCVNGRRAPCASDTVVQFITHTLAGTRLGTTNSVTFEFEWTPPSTDLGKITLYAAGNAANGNNQDTGDHIYTTSVELTPAVLTPKPVISADKGLLNAASLQVSAAAPGAWFSITGTNLATTTRTWTSEEIASGQYPTALDDVSVTVNGKPAVVEYVSPEKINILLPADDAQGPVEVRVTSHGQTSAAFTVDLQPFAPALFTSDGKYVATATGENSMLDKAGTFFKSGDPLATVKPGDTIALYGTGFGGVTVNDDGTTSLTSPVTVAIGGVPANVVAAGLAAGLPQIYQLTVLVPEGIASGDQPVVVQVGGAASSPDATYVSIQ